MAHKPHLLLLSTLVFSVAASAAQATNLVVNGGFEETTNGGGQLGDNTDATGWSTDGYNFVFTPGSADSTGVTGFYGNLQLWGPNNGSANSLPATSPMAETMSGLTGLTRLSQSPRPSTD